MLDLGRGSLARDGVEVVLRPKAFAVLAFMAANPMRLFSKDELFEAIWPNVAVTDDSLVQVIGELRRALDEDGAQLIRTVPRRGYRFEAEVVVLAPAAAPAAAPGAPRGRAWPVAGLVAVLACAVGAWSLIQFRPSPPEAPRSRPVAGVGRPAIAILPFTSLGEDRGRDHLADGMTQDLIAATGRFSGLTVMSWNAVAPWRDAPASPRDVARSLAVRYQVEGSIRLAEDRLRVVAQLVDAEGRVLWSGRFEEAAIRFFALQDRITAEIAGALAIRVTQAELERVAASPATSLEAYELVLRARPALRHPSRESLAEARSLLRRALQLDPGYPAAHAALGETFYVSTAWGWTESPVEFLGRAEAMAARALQINPTELRALVLLGRVHLAHGRHDAALAAMERAVEINPSDGQGLAGLGNAWMWLGEPRRSVEALDLARRIDPELEAMDRFALALATYLDGRYRAAADLAAANLRLSDSSVFNHVVLAAALGQFGPDGEARDALAALRRALPGFDPAAFGTKLRRPEDLEHLRSGLRKAGMQLAGTPDR